MAGTLNEVTDTNFQAEVLETDRPGARRLLGAVVRPVPRRRPRSSRRSPPSATTSRSSSSTSTRTSRRPTKFQVLSIPTLILFSTASPPRRSSAPTRRSSSRPSSSPRSPSVGRPDLGAQRPPGRPGRRRSAGPPPQLCAAPARDRRARSARSSPLLVQHAVRARAARGGSSALVERSCAWTGVPPAATTTSRVAHPAPGRDRVHDGAQARHCPSGAPLRCCATSRPCDVRRT